MIEALLAGGEKTVASGYCTVSLIRDDPFWSVIPAEIFTYTPELFKFLHYEQNLHHIQSRNIYVYSGAIQEHNCVTGISQINCHLYIVSRFKTSKTK